MSQCVPSWDLDDNPTHARLDYEVAELTWENGHLAMHGLGPPRVPAKPISSATAAAAKYTWEKPRASGTLESIVNQATRVPHRKLSFDGAAAGGGVDELVPWVDHHRAAVSAVSGTMTMDALVPNRTSHVGSCSGAAATTEDEDVTGKRARVARVAVAPEWSRDQSFTGSATIERESQHVTIDTCDRGFTSTSLGSPENTSHGKPFSKAATTTDDHDSVCHSRPQRKAGDHEGDKKKGARKSSVSTKRSRAAAVHNQSERKRRDKINQRMKTLQKMVPNSSKTDKASMLDEVIEYLKQLQAQVQMMSRMNLAPMMLPMAVQQQLQMSMLPPMAMGGMGMGMGVVDMNTIGRHNIPGISPVLHPTAFMPMSSWDGSGDRLQVAPATVMPDPLSTFLACQSQPMTMDAYSRMAAMYQQLHQHPVLLSTSKG